MLQIKKNKSLSISFQMHSALDICHNRLIFNTDKSSLDLIVHEMLYIIINKQDSKDLKIEAGKNNSYSFSSNKVISLTMRKTNKHFCNKKQHIFEDQSFGNLLLLA